MNPWALSPGQRRALTHCIPAVIADAFLREHGGDLSPKAVYALTLQATGSKAKAERARNKVIADDLAAGRTPDI